MTIVTSQFRGYILSNSGVPSGGGLHLLAHYITFTEAAFVSLRFPDLKAAADGSLCGSVYSKTHCSLDESRQEGNGHVMTQADIFCSLDCLL